MRNGVSRWIPKKHRCSDETTVLGVHSNEELTANITHRPKWGVRKRTLSIKDGNRAADSPFGFGMISFVDSDYKFCYNYFVTLSSKLSVCVDNFVLSGEEVGRAQQNSSKNLFYWLFIECFDLSYILPSFCTACQVDLLCSVKTSVVDLIATRVDSPVGRSQTNYWLPLNHFRLRKSQYCWAVPALYRNSHPQITNSPNTIIWKPPVGNYCRKMVSGYNGIPCSNWWRCKWI